jgi:hypothetical protein
VPDRRAGIVVLANGDSGSAAIDAVVQQWIVLATPVADDASQTPQADPHVRTETDPEHFGQIRQWHTRELLHSRRRP